MTNMLDSTPAPQRPGRPARSRLVTAPPALLAGAAALLVPASPAQAASVTLRSAARQPSAQLR
ncbi:hypothetical protein ABZ896_15350 [Streptomyces sp. NPDC047072]|uniref:hypothetical protein n=1 Tax=Streptomyces sp. NPDC047072 TaxID=3154809 RepID=UPI0033FD893A